MEENLTDEFTQNISISDLRRFIEKMNLNRERKVKLDLICYEKVASALYYFLIEILHGVKMFTYGRIKRRNLSFSSTLNEQDAKAIKQIHSLGVPEGDVQIVRVMDVLNASEKKKQHPCGIVFALPNYRPHEPQGYLVFLLRVLFFLLLNQD